MDKKKSKVTVVVRVRPILKAEDKNCVSCVANSIEIFNHRNVNENIKYDFTTVYDMTATQQKLFQECLKPKLLHALQGQNVSIFAYGPTGAGKTHTMLGTSSNPGVIPRVINGVFQKISEEKKACKGEQWKYNVSFSYLEIYNEKVMDLLDVKNSDLPIREDGDKNIFVPGLAKREIESFDEFKVHFGPASNNRTVAVTKLNDRSSRSHCILRLDLRKSQLCAPFRELHGKIYLIDLAGSEDNRRTGNQGIRLKESGAINKSLFVLGEVVDAINNHLPRVPYRNSKLTRLLQDSIGGSCHSVMITNIAPEQRYYYDTYCTLNFASKSKKIVNSTCVRETIPSRQELARKTPVRPDDDEASLPKKARMSVKVANTPPTMQDPAPFLSPLLRRQNRLEETVNRRLEDLEKNILNQMREMAHTNGQPASNPDFMSQLQKQLEASRQQLQTIAHHTPPSSPVPPRVLADKTNASPVKTKKSKLKRQKSENDISCSPLFAAQPRVFKKGFRSSASSSRLLDTKSPKTDDSCGSIDLQMSINEEFLTRLNTSTVKDLQSLQTVGVKRAKLIFEWREAYGLFSNYEDLKKIPGFTDKYIGNLLKSNLVAVS
ncbi:kinesin-like protein KIF22-B [Mizuhopecten yessoensis]|uniref:Kinesin-like protein n=1 Tax=Mizuhopecten yessoensis TaxID=6573 RepID=A0A210R381_MIZYE|nr:kinesin-like protein KIF22-B [Mizuhopecten yessoensis]OWF55341.1 Kinesin-like protein KIF22 [Mizuhopecten yessoensis]